MASAFYWVQVLSDVADRLISVFIYAVGILILIVLGSMAYETAKSIRKAFGKAKGL